MSLMTTRALLAVVAVTVLVLAGSAWWLGRSRGVLRRLLAVVATLSSGALLAATVMTASNQTMGWVRSTGELWHMLTASGGGSQAQVVPLSVVDGRISQALAVAVGGLHVSGGAAGTRGIAPGATGTSPAAASPAAAGTAPAAGSTSGQTGTAPAPFSYDSRLGAWRTELAGTASGVSSSVTVWTPPGWGPQDGRTYDVVVLLHGYPGSDDGPLAALDVADVVPRLMRDGVIRPTIVVVPYLHSDAGEPDCLDVTGRAQMETFVAGDVVAAVRQAFPNVTADPGGWLLAGVSSGGYCAPVLALRHPDLFYGAVSMGGYDAPQLGALAHADPATRTQATVSRMVAQSDQPVRLYVAASADDADSVALARNVTAVQRQGDRLTVDTSVGGGHSWAVWARQLPGGLAWWGQRDAGTAPAGSAGGGSAGAAAGSTASGAVAGASGDAAGASGQAAGAAGVVGASPASGGDDGAVEAGLLPSGSRVTALSLRGAGTLAAALGVSVLAVLACVLLGPRLGGRGRGRAGAVVGRPGWAVAVRGLGRGVAGYLGRVALVCVAATTVAATAGIIVNHSEVFFSSWADLAANWSTLL